MFFTLKVEYQDVYKVMKKKNIILIVSCLCSIVLCSCGSFISMGTCFKIGNSSWTEWKNKYEDFLGTYVLNPEWGSINYGGDYDHIKFFDKGRPWITYFEFKIDKGQKYDQESERSQYTGTAEYYVSDSYPTIEDILKSRGTYKAFPFISSEDGKVKRTAKATIVIETRKKRPYTYSIFFDNVGFSICLGSAHFIDSDEVK